MLIDHKRKHEVLKRIGVKKAADLSPKSKHLYDALKYYKRRIIYRKRREALRKKQPPRRELLRDAISNMDRVRARFFLSQLENEGRHYNYIKQINVMHGKDLRPVTKQNPAVFQAARSLYLKYKKR